MSPTDEHLRIDVALDPAAVVAKLAASGLFADYAVYERHGEWLFAGDAIGSVLLDTEQVRISWAATTEADVWSGRPAHVLGAALAKLQEIAPEASGHRAIGWLGFESCAYALGAERHLTGRIPLAHLMVPRIEVRVTDTGVQISGGTPDEHEAIRALALQAAADELPRGAELDIRIDPTNYRERVATAVAEIERGSYQKVILSRKVDIGFPVDMPATYRLGRRHNTPARSFLFRLGDLEATGFSPELVASVDELGEVTTEPLAGTRAFGRGADVDTAARIDLESDPKEIVEHAVSVRTSFAEIASVAEPGTTAVSEFMTVRERGSVQHLASTVRGRLAADHTGWEALDALFPSVTASGIPKRDCVDAIFRLDGEPRGLYSGAVLSVGSDGSFEATLVLRAAYQTPQGAWLRAGAGIIGQSRPEREFEETCEKLSSVSPYLVAR
ncbi:salicylate synthase [Aldersonia sp. NBC_00410]|uniref:salicylate synthase n=1 Tax=Aldersonia sp. NBC_00410 TaxID=2975954 RepID=UPI0022503C36|nr:salicylate synthase [Aldersonia sp. NBC_00410]MCX5043510.1 salicylate synthase [Aldersonia sp. NBC_00410]